MSNTLSFNSILVRLKAEYGGEYERVDGMFQFHTGSIKRTQRRRACVCADKVSIPYWFD